MQLTPARLARKSDHALAPKTAGRSHRSQFLKWLRKVHGWIGLWGAVLGLLFGVTGFLQNHRAAMRIKVGQPPHVTAVQLPVAASALTSPRDLAQFVRTELKLDRPASGSNKQAAQPVAWGDQSLIQPERWTVRFIAPNCLVNAEYWKGSTFVSVERRDQGVVAVLEAMHRANGTSIGWILLCDSIAGSLVLLSITGVVLWTELNRKRMLGASIFTTSVIAAILFAMQSL
ncbi:PepSY-associated TM helix domain-containing protein [Paraburkholderia strydomiana]|uniref:PepSY-associated TM helix domain-containing protein n=1 Tax=Paraburkholderia strydomiana TaxID=1245417 RepID=UPI0038B7DC85